MRKRVIGSDAEVKFFWRLRRTARWVCGPRHPRFGAGAADSYLRLHNENNVTEDDLLAFAANSIGSVWALELLLLLRRDPSQGWTPLSLIRELRSSPVAIEEALQRLQSAGLVGSAGAGTYCYDPASPQLDGVASNLQKLYGAKPAAVIEAIVVARSHASRASNGPD
jgi:hypothetical protein